MSTVLVVFVIGVAVSLIVAKGVMQANDFAKAELDRLENSAQDKVVE